MSNDTLKLDELGISGLLQDTESQTDESGRMHIEISLIDEDPNQPRIFFDDLVIDALTESIKSDGVRQAISVRENGDRYTVNTGAQRLRASIKAGLKVIPATIDNEFDTLDQISENTNRADMTQRELALAISRLLENEGFKQVEISKRTGLSRSYISLLASANKYHELVQELFFSDRIEIQSAQKLNKAIVDGFEHDVRTFIKEIPSDEVISRSEINELIKSIDFKRNQQDMLNDSIDATPDAKVRIDNPESGERSIGGDNIADEIELDDIADEIEPDNIADEIELDNIADEIELDNIADEIESDRENDDAFFIKIKSSDFRSLKVMLMNHLVKKETTILTKDIQEIIDSKNKTLDLTKESFSIIELDL